MLLVECRRSRKQDLRILGANAIRVWHYCSVEHQNAMLGQPTGKSRASEGVPVLNWMSVRPGKAPSTPGYSKIWRDTS